MPTPTTYARRGLTIAKALPGVALALVTILSAVTPEVLDLLADLSEQGAVDTSWLSSTITEWSARAITWLVAGATVVARVTRVPEQLKGLDPMRTITTAITPEGPDGP